MNRKIAEFIRISVIEIDIDQIYEAMPIDKLSSQLIEKELRKEVASRFYKNYLFGVSRNHLIQVMVCAVIKLMKSIPKEGVSLDICGCWGWHWRKLLQTRSDVSVVILDFVRRNLNYAKKILGLLIVPNIIFVHGDANFICFPDSKTDVGFDGV